jgi:hypothetical protein
MLDHFEPAGLTVQMFMTVEKELHSEDSSQVDTNDVARESRLASVWGHLAEAVTALNEYVAARKNKQAQTPMSASPEC